MTDTKATPIEDLGDYRDLHAWLGKKIPIATLQVWVHRDQIPHLRLAPRTVKFSRRAIEAWLHSRRCGPEAA